jgi:hypothetical protein
MMEMEELSETLVINSILTCLIAQEDFGISYCRCRQPMARVPSGTIFKGTLSELKYQGETRTRVPLID